MRATVSEKGQITIPKRARDVLGIRPSDRLDVVVVDGELRLRKHQPTDPVDDCFGILDLPESVDDFLKEIRGTG